MRSSAEQAHPPKRHGASNDPDYPSPRTLRRTLAFLLDMAIHIACGIGAGAAVSPEFSPEALRHSDWQHLGVNPAAVVGCWLAASFIDRVIIQAIAHTTIGKAVFGLVVLCPDTGQIPSPGRLLAAWLLDVWMPIAILADIAGNGGSLGPDKIGDYILPAVRRRDLRQHNIIEQP
ncbi:RDD family protein [Nocardia terpenica]|nr:RDD family protein [Nocardia terpenica]